MAKQFTTKEAKQLLQSHHALIELLENNCAYADKQKEEVSSIAANLIARNVFSNYAVNQLLSGNAATSAPADIQQLIRPLYKYIKSLPLSEESKRFQTDTQESINLAMGDLKPGASGLQ